MIRNPLLAASRYPPGITDHAVQSPLDRVGIHNVYRTVLFRIKHDVIE